MAGEVHDRNTVEPLSIAVVTAGDPRDRRVWSGLPFHMVRALESLGHRVECLGPLRPSPPILERLRNRAAGLGGRRVKHSHSVAMARRWGAEFSARIAAGRYDVVFGPAASAQLAYLATDVPVVYLSDTTFALVEDQYRGFSSLTARAAAEGRRLDRLAISRAAALIYSSRWAARSAIADAGADGDRVQVIPFGANLDQAPPEAVVKDRRAGPVCRLLFLAAEWERKGGPTAVATLDALRARGVPAELVVCGAPPPATVAAHPGVTAVPFLDKNDPIQRERLAGLLSTSSLLVLPSQADCSPVVLCEAAAYGLPVACSDVGGLPEIVVDGETGMVLPSDAGPAEYATGIEQMWGDEAGYRRAAVAARSRYDSILNWDAWARAASGVFTSVLG